MSQRHKSLSLSPWGKRLLKVESLENRLLLSATIEEIQTTWPDLDIDANTTLIEIQAVDLNIGKLNEAIHNAESSPQNDLILLYTTDSQKTISFSSVKDELIINTEHCGRITILAWGSQSLTVDACSQSRILTVQSGTVQIANLIFENGYSVTDQQGSITKCGQGGAIVNGGLLTLDKVKVLHNTVGCGAYDPFYSGFNSKGGGIYNTGTLTIIDSEIKSNKALSGPINDYDSTAFGAGGGIFNNTGASLTLINTTVSANTAQSDTLKTQTDGSRSDIVLEIEQYGSGGGIYNYGGFVSVTGGEITANYANTGAGISNIFATQNGQVNLSEVSLRNNSAKKFGGGVYNGQKSVLAINSCYLLQNKAGKDGGAINNMSNIKIINSVISGNTSGISGGGIYSFWNANMPIYTVSVTNVTITGNKAGASSQGSGGGIFFAGGIGVLFAQLTLNNSIIVNNIVIYKSGDSDDENIYCVGNCNGNYSLSTFQMWANKDKGINYLYDPALTLFALDYDFDSETLGDYHLIPDSHSQAIDTGNNNLAGAVGLNVLSTDLGGKNRVQNKIIDLGAFEYHSSPFDEAFPSNLSIQEGASFSLECLGTDSNENRLTNYLIDLDGDSIIDISGNEILISYDQLVLFNNKKGLFWLAFENELGQTSDLKVITVSVINVLPLLTIQHNSLKKGQLLQLELNALYFGNSTVQQWTIDWGDGTKSQYNHRSCSLVASHYYSWNSTYSISLNLIDDDNYNDNNSRSDTVFYIGSHLCNFYNKGQAEPDLTETGQRDLISSDFSLWILEDCSKDSDRILEEELDFSTTMVHYLYAEESKQELLFSDSVYLSDQFFTALGKKNFFSH